MRRFNRKDLFRMKNLKKQVSVILAAVLTVLSFSVMSASGASESQLRDKISQLESQSQQLEQKIKQLKAQNADQQALADAIQAKINNTQQQINACNSEINRINGVIAQNKAEIAQKNQEIEDSKDTFKKRLRAIYMNNASSSVQILLGAQDFSEYLQLEQLTASVSAHDQQIIEDIVAAVKVLEAKQAENEKLLNDQVSVKNTILAKQQELQAQQAEVQSIISSLSAETSDLTQENKDVEAHIKKAQQDLDALFRNYGTGSNVVYDGNGFYWPVPSCRTINQGYKGSGHTGIDIGGAYGAPIIASADGVVLTAVTGQVRNPSATGLASYGNYVVIDHGNKNGVNYKTYSAHMSSVAVSVGQTVKQGQVIGYVGNSGRTIGSTGTHLHFEIRITNAHTNPLKYLRYS